MILLRSLSFGGRGTLPVGLPIASGGVGQRCRSAGVLGVMPPTTVSDSGGTT